MYVRWRDNALAYADDQRRRYRLWQELGDGPGHYDKKCIVCGEPFMAARRNARFCDRRCYDKRRRRDDRACTYCGRVTRMTQPQKYCSASCRVMACRDRRQARWPKLRETDRPPGEILDVIRF